MKKYKFLIKELTEMEIQVSAESHSEALFKMLQKVAKRDNKFFTDVKKSKKHLFINIKKIIDEKGRENLKDKEDFIKENNFFISKINKKIFGKENEEIEDNLEKKYAEVVSNRCGNCILIDEIIHQLYS